MTDKERDALIAETKAARDLDWIWLLKDMGLNAVARAAYAKLKGRPYEGRETDSDWLTGKARRKDET